MQRLKELETILLAAVGGTLGYLMRTIRRGKRVRLTLCGLEACASGFVGYLIFLLCRAMKIDDNWVGPIVGVFGWVGASSSIRLLERVVNKKLGLGDDKDVAATGERTAVKE